MKKHVKTKHVKIVTPKIITKPATPVAKDPGCGRIQ